MFGGDLLTREIEFTRCVLDELSGVNWAKPLVQEIHRRGGIVAKNGPMLFEARVAYALHQANINPIYEYKAGVGESSVDFYLLGPPKFLVEIVSLQESQGVRNATWKQDGFIRFCLSDHNLYEEGKDRQTEVAQLLYAQWKLIEKVYAKGRPIKFPIPTKNVYHVILADMRGYLGGAGLFGSSEDFIEIVYGGACLLSQTRWRPHGIPQKDGTRSFLTGLFQTNKEYPSLGGRYLRQRVHLIGFVVERAYQPDEIGTKASTCFFSNPYLLKPMEASELVNTFPLAQDD